MVSSDVDAAADVHDGPRALAEIEMGADAAAAVKSAAKMNASRQTVRQARQARAARKRSARAQK